MKLKELIETLRPRKVDMLKHFKRKKITESSITEFCGGSGIPIIVACVYIREEFPEHTEMVNKKIKSIKEFYGYKEEV